MWPPDMKAASVFLRLARSDEGRMLSSGSTHPAPANWPVNDQSNSATSAMYSLAVLATISLLWVASQPVRT